MTQTNFEERISDILQEIADNWRPTKQDENPEDPQEPDFTEHTQAAAQSTHTTRKPVRTNTKSTVSCWFQQI